MIHHYTVGTAGHIDHGKTSLTQCLTGQNTDRLHEEKERNISIELGFAPFTLPSGKQISVIDVPGHERFIRHMVAGVAGIDLVLLVVAADEGVMPQTVEHLHILHLLGVSHGIVVLTKCDLVEPDFMELVREDVREAVSDTFLTGAPVCETSTVTQSGISALKQQIEHTLNSVSARSSEGPFFLPIDRVFTVKGAGTVVTGTVYSGRVSPGDELDVLPDQLEAKVRHVQVHGRDAPSAFAGQRAALNITQLKKQTLTRGQVLATPGQWSATNRVDAFVRWLPTAPAMKHQSSIKLFIGGAECHAELILYDRPALQAGDEAYISLRLQTPITASRQDRFILRRPTPATTVGGGEIVRPYAQKLKFHPSSATYLQRMHESDLTEWIRDALWRGPLVQRVDELAQALTESKQEITDTLHDMQQSDQVATILSQPQSVGLVDRLAAKVKESTTWLEHFHRRYPLRQGALRAEWVSRFIPGLSNQTVDALLHYWRDYFKVQGEDIAIQSFTASIPEPIRVHNRELMETITQQGLETDSWSDLTKRFGIPADLSEDLLAFHTHQGNLIQLGENRVITREAFQLAKQQIVGFLENERHEITMQDVKTMFNLSRKYTVPLMETMDREHVTRRKGNVRTLF